MAGIRWLRRKQRGQGESKGRYALRKWTRGGVLGFLTHSHLFFLFLFFFFKKSFGVQGKGPIVAPSPPGCLFEAGPRYRGAGGWEGEVLGGCEVKRGRGGVGVLSARGYESRSPQNNLRAPTRILPVPASLSASRKPRFWRLFVDGFGDIDPSL